MAKYEVIKYSSSVLDNPEHCKNIYISCELVNRNGNVKTHYYRICNDTRYPDLDFIKSIIDTGFNYAKNKQTRIEISLYSERMYVFMRLPDINGRLSMHQFTGFKEKEPFC